MDLDERILLALLQQDSDSYIIGYRWVFESPFDALQVRRRVVNYANHFPSAVCATLAADVTTSDRGAGAACAFRTSLTPIPDRINILFLQVATEVEVFAFAHHIFFDGTALWNAMRVIFSGGLDPIAGHAERVSATREVIQRTRARLAGVAPAAEPHVWWIEDLMISQDIIDQSFEAIRNRTEFESLLTSRRTSQDGGRLSGTKVEYEAIYGPGIGYPSLNGGRVASVTVDLFAQDQAIDGLRPCGVVGYSHRTDCDALIEQIGRKVKISVIGKLASDKYAMIDALKSTLGRPGSS